MSTNQSNYPTASSAATSASMRANRRRDTSPELAIRQLLFAEGRRYRVDMAIRTRANHVVHPDIVFTRRRVCVFVDGCFWHGCPAHFRMPAANRAYWEAKIAKNRARDVRNTTELRSDGWAVIRIWEHTPPELAIREIDAALDATP